MFHNRGKTSNNTTAINTVSNLCMELWRLSHAVTTDTHGGVIPKRILEYLESVREYHPGVFEELIEKWNIDKLIEALQSLRFKIESCYIASQFESLYEKECNLENEDELISFIQNSPSQNITKIKMIFIDLADVEIDKIGIFNLENPKVLELYRTARENRICVFLATNSFPLTNLSQDTTLGITIANTLRIKVDRKVDIAEFNAIVDLYIKLLS